MVSGANPAADGETPSAPLEGAGSLEAVEVVLRLGGSRVGRGFAQRDRATLRTAGALVDLAVDRALADARQHPSVENLSAAGGTLLRDALSLELTLIGEPQEFPAIQWSDAEGRFAPGLDALWVAAPGSREWLLPAEQLRHGGASAESLLLRIALRAGLAARPLADLRQGADVRLGRASVIRLRQLTPADPPDAVAYRHALRTPPTTESLQESAALAAGFLAAAAPEVSGIEDESLRGQIEALGLGDRWNDADGRFKSPSAPPLSQALAALALVRAAPLLDEPLRAEAARAAAMALNGLALTTGGEPPTSVHPGAEACAVAAAASAPPGFLSLAPATNDWLAECAARMERRMASSDPASTAQRGTDVFARAMRAARSGDEAERLEARLAIVRAWDELGSSQLVGIAPWLLLAGRELAQPGADPEAWVAECSHHPSIARATDVLRATQWLSAGIDGSQSPLCGAFLQGMAPDDPHAAPQVGAPSALPAIGIAAAAERAGGAHRRDDPLAACAFLAAGFLATLPTDAYGADAALPAAPLGGVGATPWEAECTVGYTALVLLSLTELHRIAPPAAAMADPGAQ